VTLNLPRLTSPSLDRHYVAHLIHDCLPFIVSSYAARFYKKQQVQLDSLQECQQQRASGWRLSGARAAAAAPAGASGCGRRIPCTGCAPLYAQPFPHNLKPYASDMASWTACAEMMWLHSCRADDRCLPSARRAERLCGRTAVAAGRGRRPGRGADAALRRRRNSRRTAVGGAAEQHCGGAGDLPAKGEKCGVVLLPAWCGSTHDCASMLEKRASLAAAVSAKKGIGDRGSTAPMLCPALQDEKLQQPGLVSITV